MKKLTTTVLAAIGLLAALPASATPIAYTSSFVATNTTYDKTLTFNVGNHAFLGSGVLDWTFLFDPSFSLPGSSISEAKLFVSARQATGANDFMSVNSAPLVGALLPGSGNSQQETAYNLLSLFNTSATWSASNPLSLAMQLSYVQPASPGNKALTLEYARVSLKFSDITAGNGTDDNGAPQEAPGTVPEPGTAALFGLGLAGALLAQRRRKA